MQNPSVAFVDCQDRSVLANEVKERLSGVRTGQSRNQPDEADGYHGGGN